MNNQLDNFICNCGHTKQAHKREQLQHYQIGNFYSYFCNDCIKDGIKGKFRNFIECSDGFKPNNLKYIEYKYEQSTK